MQEEITQGAVSLSVEAGKMTADLLQKALKKVLEEMQKKPSQRTLRQGKQTLHQLKQHGASLTNIEITEQNIKAFSAVAKKYDIDYALKKDPHTEPPHYRRLRSSARTARRRRPGSPRPARSRHTSDGCRRAGRRVSRAREDPAPHS